MANMIDLNWTGEIGEDFQDRSLVTYQLLQSDLDWFPKWRSRFQPWKGRLWVQTRSLWRTCPTGQDLIHSTLRSAPAESSFSSAAVAIQKLQKHTFLFWNFQVFKLGNRTLSAMFFLKLLQNKKHPNQFGCSFHFWKKSGARRTWPVSPHGKRRMTGQLNVSTSVTRKLS